MKAHKFPVCLWSLPNITWLYAAGNGYLGELPDDAFVVTRSLLFVNLARNKLGGTLSTSLTAHPFVELDISFNKIAGSFSFTPFPENITRLLTNFTNKIKELNPSLAYELFTNDLLSYQPQYTYATAVNRLAGYLPASLSSLQRINILNGMVYFISIAI